MLVLRPLGKYKPRSATCLGPPDMSEVQSDLQSYLLCWVQRCPGEGQLQTKSRCCLSVVCESLRDFRKVRSKGKTGCLYGGNGLGGPTNWVEWGLGESPGQYEQC